MKPTNKAIKNNHYASWTGLTYEGVNKHFPESEEKWNTLVDVEVPDDHAHTPHTTPDNLDA